MIPAATTVQRPPGARLLAVDQFGNVSHHARRDLLELLRPGDLLVANDAATLPASLEGFHAPTGRPIEVRLAARRSVDIADVRQFTAIVFGEGDFRVRTEDRPSPPSLAPGDPLILGPLRAVVAEVLGHPRFITLVFNHPASQVMEGLARHGRPIQYAHLREPLAVWDTWTAIAGPPVAFEPPSAGFVLDWNLIHALPSRGIRFATITHVTGISSTGDPCLDACLPLDEPYRIPESTAHAIQKARMRDGRIVAVGTSVVRALEHAAGCDGSIEPGESVATQHIDASTRLLTVDCILTGTHEPGSSHYELLRAFIDAEVLMRADHELNAHHYRTHEFGDSVFVEKSSLRLDHLRLAPYILAAGARSGGCAAASAY